MMGKKVIVGMSGGVDSTMAAWLLKKQGYEVIGATVLTCGGSDGAGLEERIAENAAALKIPHIMIDFRQEFQTHVVDYFVEEYLAGRTPNPCIACNRFIKWEALLQKSREIGAEFIATGHYARTEQLPSGRYTVRNAASAEKDQTYALYRLTQEQLAHTLMPLGEYAKKEIRALAQKYQLPSASMPDSQDICFVPDGDYAGFIERQAQGRVPGPGNFVLEDGRVAGTHKGITHYTIGQRKGLGLSMGQPVFVSQLRPETNEVVISLEDGYQKELDCENLNYMGAEGFKQIERLWAKVRYAHKGAWCRAWETGPDRVHVVFEEPVRAVTPGQAIVFYDGEYVMGGGIICSAGTKAEGAISPH